MWAASSMEPSERTETQCRNLTDAISLGSGCLPFQFPLNFLFQTLWAETRLRIFRDWYARKIGAPATPVEITIHWSRAI